MKTMVSEKASTFRGIFKNASRMKSKKDIENEEIQLRLTRLTSLVPTIPKDRVLTSLEIIQYVIEYIILLEDALDAHPNINAAAVQAAAAVMLCSTGQQSSANVPIVAPLHRQPLKVLPPNANVSVNSKTSPDTSMVSSSRQSEKVSSTTSSKTFPC